ncbi:lmo0954 family membrane protein [Bacillus xiapuensis]|uniref:lmo0954 family membrane protein n=1 Tax=Bacillus xiapuensis TaxID=2014075 RepID=UPI0012FD9C18|nr:flagellar basal body rod protein [Bacillus xiapuensis]
MKKVILFCIGGLAALIAATSLAPIIGLAICAVVMYTAWVQIQKTPSIWAKGFWGMAGVIAFIIAIANVPALLGVGALAVLYMVYVKWNEEDQELVQVQKETDDPFINFEREWQQLTK